MTRETRIGPTTFIWGVRTYVMGILNVTPDSFSGDALGADVDAALRRAERMLAEGADIIDVGGESTRPGAQPVPLDEELARVVPVVEALARRFPVPISVDTTKSEVARQALAAGATIVNDVWGMRRDPAMAAVAAGSAEWVVLMHNREARPSADHVGGHYADVRYADVVAEVAAWLRDSAEVAIAGGVTRERIILDPGLGFGKTYAQNLELIRRLPELNALGYPLLVGASRKSFTGRALDLPLDQRLETSLAVLTLCIAGGADIVRVHDVLPSVRAARMADEIVRGPLQRISSPRLADRADAERFEMQISDADEPSTST
jgi:dihydropteroate synthase